MSITRSPLDPQIQIELARQVALGLPPMETLGIEELRARELAGIDLSAGEPVARVENRIILGPGGPILPRIYWPAGVASLPGLVYFHGGRFILGSLNTHDALAGLSTALHL